MRELRGDFPGWILESLSTGVVAIDTGGALVALNAGARRILGCSGGPGGDCRDVLAAEPTVAKLLLDAVDGRSALSRAELELRGDAGRPATTIGFTLAPVRDPGGRVRGAAMIFRDLTAFERADEQDRLRERLAALGQMAAGLAHEIRNPLAGMEVAAGLLKRRLGDRPEELRLVSDLLEELRVLAGTVSAGLDFVRPVALERSRVQPVALVEEALRLARSRLAFRGVVERDYAEPLPELHADAEQLRAVVTNLVVNAFEAMSEPAGRPPRLVLGVFCEDVGGPRRSVRVGADGRLAGDGAEPARELVISVSDSGPGIDPEIREKIFYPFFTTKQRGSGVGLALAQKIAASHGGVLELESRGAGTRFQLRLPVEPPPGGAP